MADVFVEEWFKNPKWWFDASREDDEYITQVYGQLLDEDKDLSDPFNRLIVYDQLPRHVFRGTVSAHIITFFLQKALDSLSLIDTSSLPIEKWCFAMLPIRHSGHVARIHGVMKEAWNALAVLVVLAANNAWNPWNDAQNNTLTKRAKTVEDTIQLRRFLKATYERCPIADQRDIMTYHKCSDSSGSSNTLITSSQNPNRQFKQLLSEFQTKLQSMGNKKLLLSLSGGVDSMVCLTCLHLLLSQHKVDFEIVHINYCNRSSSMDEEEFVVSWAKSLGLNAWVRRITEIQRDPCMKHDMRSTYETYTRNIRYACYKSIGGTVVLGHNKDDCLENIFQNISHQSKYENLNGMSALGEQDGIEFFRPLLGIPKQDIIDFASAYNIPTLPNSTPTWSQRGQIRNKIVPVMDEWNKDFIPGMYKLSDTIKEMYTIVSKVVNDIAARFIDKRAVCKLDELHNSEIFWSMLLERVMNRKFSTRSVRSLLERLTQHQDNSDIKNKRIINFTLSKDVCIRLDYEDATVEISLIISSS